MHHKYITIPTYSYTQITPALENLLSFSKKSSEGGIIGWTV